MKSLHVLICLFGAVAALYSSSSPVVKLTQANFEKEVKGSSELWFVEFFAPWCGHCKNLAPEYEKAAKALKGVVRLGAVDMTTDQSVGAPYDVKGFPTIKFFGENKAKPLDYNGGRTAKDIVDFAMSQAQDLVKKRMGGGSSSSGSSSSGSKSSSGGHQDTKGDGDVIVLEDSNFDTVFEDNDLWLVEFYAPWCGHCKNLAPEWNKAASNLKGQVKVAKVDATANERMASKYGVKGYPTIKVFLPNEKQRPDDYNGPRDADGITNYALQKLEAFGVPLELKQLTDSSVLEAECPSSEPRVCILVFLPHIMDSSAKEREQYLESIREASKKARSKPMRFLWAQGGDHFSFEEKLGMNFGYPAVLAVSTQKSRYAIMRSAFNAAELESFVSKILSGGTALIPYEKLPKLGTAQPWDGKDAPVIQEDL